MEKRNFTDHFREGDSVVFSDLDNNRVNANVVEIVDKIYIKIQLLHNGQIIEVPGQACSITPKYKVLNKERVVYCDVDDTLILWEPEKYPGHDPLDTVVHTDTYGQWRFLKHIKNIDFLIKLKRQGYGVVVWSAAGAAWAETVVKMLELEEFVDVVLSKPELAMDDLLEPNRIIKSVVWIDPKTGEYQRNSK